MFHRVNLVRTDVSEERSASIIKVTRIGELGTKLAITSNRRLLQRKLLVTVNVVLIWPIILILMMEALRSSETSFLTITTLRNIPEDSILPNHCRENLKSYIQYRFYIIPRDILWINKSYSPPVRESKRPCRIH
jgi:hypothetical protein